MHLGVYVIVLTILFSCLFFIPLGNALLYSLLLGIFVLLIVVILGLISLNKINKTDEALIISSNLTPFYKFYFPTFIIVTLIFNTVSFLLKTYPLGDISISIILLK